MVKSISSESEYKKALAEHPLVMIKFSAQWCGPCKAVAPIIDKMQPMFPQVFMGDVDVDENSEVARANNITAMPTFVFFKNGTEVSRVRGGDIPKIAKELESLQS